MRKFPSTVSGLIQWALHTVEIWRDKVGLSVNPNKTELIVFTRRRKHPVSLNHTFLGLLYITLRQSSIQGSPGFSAGLEGAFGCQDKEGSQFLVDL